MSGEDSPVLSRKTWARTMEPISKVNKIYIRCLKFIIIILKLQNLFYISDWIYERCI